MNSLTNPTDFPEPTLIAVNGVELEVFEAGRQNAGKPVVLCHGWPDLAFTWRHQVPALVAAGYHVIAPNQRGYGNSSRPAEVTAYDVGAPGRRSRRTSRLLRLRGRDLHRP